MDEPIEDSNLLRSSSAYLIQRLYTQLEDDSQIAKWQAKTASLREKEQIESTINSILTDDPQSFWARAIRAHRFAVAGDWEQAATLARPLSDEAPNDAFIKDLVAAIRSRANLPPISRIPIKKF